MYYSVSGVKGFTKMDYNAACDIIRRMVESGDYGSGRISFKLNL